MCRVMNLTFHFPSSHACAIQLNHLQQYIFRTDQQPPFKAYK